jgi:hypothetical protein
MATGVREFVLTGPGLPTKQPRIWVVWLHRAGIAATCLLLCGASALISLATNYVLIRWIWIANNWNDAPGGGMIALTDMGFGLLASCFAGCGSAVAVWHGHVGGGTRRRAMAVAAAIELCLLSVCLLSGTLVCFAFGDGQAANRELALALLGAAVLLLWLAGWMTLRAPAN